jgi:hypothetical protein
MESFIESNQKISKTSESKSNRFDMTALLATISNPRFNCCKIVQYDFTNHILFKVYRFQWGQRDSLNAFNSTQKVTAHFKRETWFRIVTEFAEKQMEQFNILIPWNEENKTSRVSFDKAGYLR